MFLLLWRASMAPLWSAIHWPLGGIFYWLKWKRWPLWVTNTNWKPCLGGMGWSRAIHKCQSGGQDDWFLTSSIGDSAGFKLPACRMVIGGDCDSSASEMQEITIHSSWIYSLVHDPYRNVRISFDICRESLGLFRCHPLQACMRVGNGVRWDLRPLSVYKWGQESIPPACIVTPSIHLGLIVCVTKVVVGGRGQPLGSLHHELGVFSCTPWGSGVSGGVMV